MKISVTKDDLANGLQIVQNVVGARSTLPILSNVLIVAGDNKLEMRATDLEVSVHASVPAKRSQILNQGQARYRSEPLPARQEGGRKHLKLFWERINSTPSRA